MQTLRSHLENLNNDRLSVLSLEWVGKVSYVHPWTGISAFPLIPLHCPQPAVHNYGTE